MIWAGVVDMQPAPGAQLEISLGDHSPTLVMVTGWPGGNRSHRAGGAAATSRWTSPAELRKVMHPDLGVALIDLDRSQA